MPVVHKHLLAAALELHLLQELMVQGVPQAVECHHHLHQGVEVLLRPGAEALQLQMGEVLLHVVQLVEVQLEEVQLAEDQ